MKYIDHHDLDPPGPNLQHVGVCYLALQKVQTWIFYILTSSQGSMTS
jgi:hypothetical protein